MENIQEKEAWASVLELVANKFSVGEIIEHNQLKEILLITEPSVSDYENIYDYLKARDLIQFEYMSLVQKLKKDLLINHKLCLWSSFGVGYYLLEPSRQVKTAYDEAIKDIKKSLRNAFNIMTNVRNYGDHEKQRSDTDLVARFSMIRGMLAKIYK